MRLRTIDSLNTKERQCDRRSPVGWVAQRKTQHVFGLGNGEAIVEGGGAIALDCIEEAGFLLNPDQQTRSRRKVVFEAGRGAIAGWSLQGRSPHNLL